MERLAQPVNGWRALTVSRALQSPEPAGLRPPAHSPVQHAFYMRRALQLAHKALGHTTPNPLVGAVIIKHGRIVGEGYHHRAGLPHAEIEALRRAGPRARNGTLYVNLEPCNHTGRTPPCCEAILASGLSRVVIAMHDPNPLTNGRGIARLRRAGITIVTGVLEQEAQALNAPFTKVMTRGLPFVVAKVAQSLDGKIATSTGESRWITSAAARRVGHQWRSRVDAILVGINTVLKDDPRLAVRGARPRRGRPIKVIVDSRLRTPRHARCLSSASPAPSLIATTVNAPSARRDLRRPNVEVIALPPRQGRVPLRRLLSILARRGIHSILLEGGGELLAGALEERLVDQVICLVAPMMIGGRSAPTAMGGRGIRRISQAVRLKHCSCRRLGEDWCVEGQVRYPRHALSNRRSATKHRPP